MPRPSHPDRESGAALIVAIIFLLLPTLALTGLLCTTNDDWQHAGAAGGISLRDADRADHRSDERPHPKAF
jgi:hypothetical protein